MLQDDPDVVDGGLGQAGLRADLQQLHPTVIDLAGIPVDRRKNLRGGLPAFLQQQPADAAVVGGGLAHGQIGGQPIDGRIGRGAVVQIAEAVQTDEVKGVHQLAAARICSMMGIQELAIVIEHRTAGGGAAEEGEAPGHGIHRCIDIGQECLHSSFDVVDAAESAHNAVFSEGVSLLGRRSCKRSSARQSRPGGDIMPILVCTQQPVHRKHFPVGVVEDILAVATAAGPVHQAAGLEGGLIGQLHANEIGHASGAGLVFVSGAGAAERQQHTQPRSRRHMLASGVDAVPAV